MLRKVTSLMVTLIGLSLLVLAGELAVLTLVRAPAQGFAGASLQASGLPAHPVEPGIPPMSEPLHLPGRSGPVETGRQTSWPAALLAQARKTSLRPEAVPGQWLQPGEYDTRTGPTGAGSAANVGKAITYAAASAGCMAAAALLAYALANRRRQEAQAAQAAVALREAAARRTHSRRLMPELKLEHRHAPKHAPWVTAQRKAPRRIGSGLRHITHHHLWAVIVSAVPEGPEVRWERIRLVPT